MTAGPTPTYTTEDFSAVNGYIDRMSARHTAAIQHHRALTSEVYIRWAVVALAICGISAALIIWALSALTEKPEPRIIEPRVVQSPPVTITIDGSQLTPGGTGTTSSSGAVSDARRAAEKKVESMTTAPPPTEPGTGDPVNPPVSEVVNFVIFREIPFVRGKVNKINVGMRYDKSADETPTAQWCYVNAPNLSGSSVWVTLSNKYGGQRYDEQLTATVARELGMSLGDLHAAQRLCSFD